MNEHEHAMEERQHVWKKEVTTRSMVLIKDDMKDKTLLNIGRIESEIKRKDGVTRNFKIRLGNGYVIERAI